MDYTEILQSCHELWVLRWLAHVWVKSRRRGPVGKKKKKRTLYESKMNRNEEKRGNIQQIRGEGERREKGEKWGKWGEKECSRFEFMIIAFKFQSVTTYPPETSIAPEVFHSDFAMPDI